MPGPAKKTAAAPKRKDVLRVSAPLVQVSLGERVIQLSNGDVVPDGATDESVAHLMDLGYVTKGDAPAEVDEN